MLKTLYLVLLLAVSSAGAQESRVPPRGRVAGIVYDSVRTEPLKGALVQLLRETDATATRTTTSDSAGQFVFDTVAAGQWILGALHPRLDSLAIQQFARRVEVKERGTSNVRLAIPGASTLIRQLCGAQTANDTLGVIFGTVQQVSGDRTGVAGTLRVRWVDVMVSTAGIQREVTGFDLTTGERGGFAACGVPKDARVQLLASSGRDSSGVLDVMTAASGINRLDIFVGTSERRLVETVVELPDSGVVVKDTLRTAYLRGAGRLIAQVESPGRGPIPGARMSLWGSGLEGTTDSTGRAELLTLPLGSHTLEIRAIGYAPLRMIVDVPANEPLEKTVTMERLGTLDTVRVTAVRLLRNAQFDATGFSQRRRSGAGVYLSPEDIANIDPLRMADLYASIPSVQVSQGGRYGETIQLRSNGRYCTPTVWVDGRETDFEQFNSLVLPREVIAMEVYRRLASAPPQFISARNLGTDCGAVVIWTGVRVKPVTRAPQ
jgi:hypothetical protein